MRELFQVAGRASYRPRKRSLDQPISTEDALVGPGRALEAAFLFGVVLVLATALMFAVLVEQNSGSSSPNSEAHAAEGTP
jgi:hypothetical protein